MDTLVILLPLAVGYLIPLRHAATLKLIDRSLMIIVYAILLLMGVGLGGMDNLSQEIGGILALTATLIGLTLIANLAALPWVERRWPLGHDNPHGKVRTLIMVLESLQLALVVIAGVVIGLLWPQQSHHIESLVNGILMLMLLFIGVQLRASGMSVKQIILNPRGMAIAAAVLLSSLAAGALTALLWGLPINHGMALAAGTGWYSLSGALVSAQLGPALGSVAFLADLSRELIAIILIPLLMARSAITAIGYGGATAMDFTLPVIQKSGGSQVVPIAIVSGFILSLLGPILIPFLLSF